MTCMWRKSFFFCNIIRKLKFIFYIGAFITNSIIFSDSEGQHATSQIMFTNLQGIAGAKVQCRFTFPRRTCHRCYNCATLVIVYFASK